MSEPAFPRDDLVRAVYPGVELREAEATDDDTPRRPTLVGHFARFNEWTTIDSVYEGRFLECIAPGAFARSLTEDRDRMRVLFQHGKDPQVGDKPLGPIAELEEDGTGARYAVPLLDTSYNRDLEPGLREGLYGASFRFSIPEGGEAWEKRPRRSTHNPEGLPERTITEARVFEFGPVTFPAYAGATAGVRSMTDDFRSSEPDRDTTPTPVKETNVDQDEVVYYTRDEKAARATVLKDGLAKMAVEYPGVLPTEAQERWDKDTAELETLERDIRAYDARQEQLRRYATSPRHVEEERTYTPPNIVSRPSESDIFDVRGIITKSTSPEDRNQRFRDNAIRAAEQLRTAGERYDRDKSRERLISLIEHNDSDDKEIARRVLAAGSPQYREAFVKYIASGGQERGTALAVGVDATGGFAVPVSFDPTIIAIGAHTAINPYRQACRVVTIAGTDTWQALTATAITAAYATEAAAATEQGPTFARPEFVAKRAHAFVTASYEMAQDRPGLPGELGVLFGEAKDTLEENQFTVGAGSTVYPQGLGLKDAVTRVDSVGNDVVAVADIRAVEAAVPIRHRMNAAWFLSRAAIRAIQAFETTGGQLFNGINYPATPSPLNARSGNTGLTLLGYPIWETPSMPWTPTSDDTVWGVLFDPQHYVIVDRVGMSVRVIPDMLDGATPSMPTGEIGIYAFWRNTARVLNADAGRQGVVQ